MGKWRNENRKDIYAELVNIFHFSSKKLTNRQ